ALEWIDGSRYASQHPCLDFEIYNCDPTKIVKVKVNCPFRYEDRKYSKWYYFDKNTILLLTPGRYFFPCGYTELYEKIILLPTEDPIKRCEVEVYNLDRIVFIPQAILKYNTVYETYFENSLLFHSSPGW
ncbi:MAG TPA: hypothetical protein PK131_00980, partial [Candidatus Woesebacteria bacterium]|nr:hypothetical protein [Candidatus Woesebacteria bacterium]